MLVLFAALAATGLFAQNSAWTNIMDSRVVVRPQVPIQSAPVVDAKGNVSYPVSEYKLVLYYPVVLQNDQLLPGYKRTISLAANTICKVQIKDARNNVSVIDRLISSVSPFKDSKDDDFLKVVIMVPSNYIQVYITFDAIFTPIQVGEDIETRKVISILGNDPKLFIQPAVVATSSAPTIQAGNNTTSSQSQFNPASVPQAGTGLR